MTVQSKSNQPVTLISCFENSDCFVSPNVVVNEQFARASITIGLIPLQYRDALTF